MAVTIFDLSFVAIPDLNKQAEDIDFFFQEYIRYVTILTIESRPSIELKVLSFLLSFKREKKNLNYFD